MLVITNFSIAQIESIQKDVYGYIPHSNPSYQYTSNAYRMICESKDIQISIS